MDLTFTPEELRFRLAAREWLESNAPSTRRPIMESAALSFDLEWQRRQFEAGWAGVSWPIEFGGRGLSQVEQLIWFEEYARVGAPFAGASYTGLNNAGPVLMVHGTRRQREEFLPGILRGKDVWCQGFSEPEGGSDLAAIRTRAVREGDELVVTGQKIWTSYAEFAKYQLLLVRTGSPDARHRGLTYVICDLDTAGVDVRPIKTMAGGFEFCEVFYDAVRIPVANVLGELDDGWNVAMSTLGFERGAEIAEYVKLDTVLSEIVALGQRIGLGDSTRQVDSDLLADRIAAARAKVLALRAMAYATVSRAVSDNPPGVESSLTRMLFAPLTREVQTIAIDILGADGVIAEDLFYDDWVYAYLHSYAQTIGGGTKDIQRNLVAQRLLGLPRSA